MTEETKKLFEEAVEDLSDIIEYVYSESGDTTLHQWLDAVEDKFKKVLEGLNDVYRKREKCKRVD